MALIRCTKKLLTEMKARVTSSEQQTHATLLGDWYANLLRIDQRKCVIFTSERTLLTFLAVGLNRGAIRDFAPLFRIGLRQLLESEEFAPADVDRVLVEYQELTLAPTTDRSVLGSVTELARLAAAHVQHVGGLSRCNPGAINHELNLTPLKRLQMAWPLAATRRVLERDDLTGQSKDQPSSPRKKRPGLMGLDDVRIDRQGDVAILTPRDPGVAVTHFQLGPQLAWMTDKEILACFNEMIVAREQMAAEHPWVATEVPPGRPQIRYYPEGDQWAPRGSVVRCVVDTDEDGQAVILVDDRELSLEEFGTLLTTYAGWGMRIEFTPDDETEQRPRLEVRDPKEP